MSSFILISEKISISFLQNLADVYQTVMSSDSDKNTQGKDSKQGCYHAEKGDPNFYNYAKESIEKHRAVNDEDDPISNLPSLNETNNEVKTLDISARVQLTDAPPEHNSTQIEKIQTKVKTSAISTRVQYTDAPPVDNNTQTDEIQKQSELSLESEAIENSVTSIENDLESDRSSNSDLEISPNIIECVQRERLGDKNVVNIRHDDSCKETVRVSSESSVHVEHVQGKETNPTILSTSKAEMSISGKKNLCKNETSTHNETKKNIMEDRLIDGDFRIENVTNENITLQTTDEYEIDHIESNTEEKNTTRDEIPQYIADPTMLVFHPPGCGCECDRPGDIILDDITNQTLGNTAVSH